MTYKQDNHVNSLESTHLNWKMTLYDINYGTCKKIAGEV